MWNYCQKSILMKHSYDFKVKVVVALFFLVLKYLNILDVNILDVKYIFWINAYLPYFESLDSFSPLIIFILMFEKIVVLIFCKFFNENRFFILELLILDSLKLLAKIKITYF